MPTISSVMTKPTRTISPLRSHDALGWWRSDDRRFYECAHLQLKELEQVALEVKQEWPLPLDETVRNGDDHPELFALVRRRDMLSNSVIIFSAMAVEAFLNYYGVVRLGNQQYLDNFERLPSISKLKILLLVCDSIALPDADRSVTLLRRIAKRRNHLVHPKAKELPCYMPAEKRPYVEIPEYAQKAVQDMDNFFKEFIAIVPAAAHLVPGPVPVDES